MPDLPVFIQDDYIPNQTILMDITIWNLKKERGNMDNGKEYVRYSTAKDMT